LVNRFLDHLVARLFSAATVRAYAFDLANFLGFLVERELTVVVVRPADLFDYLEWQRAQRATVAASTMNRRVSTVRSWCEFLVTVEVLGDNPVPRARRSSGLRVVRRGFRVRARWGDGWLVSRRGCPRAWTPTMSLFSSLI
jgi:site-specific recombinase XerD